MATTAAAISPPGFAVLGVSGTAVADGPQVDDCVNALVITGGPSASNPKKVCTGPDAGDLTDGD